MENFKDIKDIVEPCSVNGRWCSHVWADKSSIHYEVAKDEEIPFLAMNKTHYTIREFFDKFPELANIRGVVSTRLCNLAYYGFIEKKAIKDTTPKSKWEYKKEDIITAIRHYCPDFLTATPAKPKYDPCRKFRKGDKVRVVEYKGRCKKSHCLRVGDILSIAKDEANDDTFIAICERNNTSFYLDPAYIELVTPVEEIEPYVVRLAITDGVEEWHVEQRNNNLALVAVFGHRHPNAKAAAEAECARLNAEHRKEQK